MDRYFNNLLEILDEGETLRFADGSLFRVDPFDLPEVSGWYPNSEINLAKTRDHVFNYTLVNLDNAAWIRAMKLN